MHDIAIYQQRRQQLALRMIRGVAFIPTAPERVRNRDSHYPFRFDSYFHYLTGFPEPEAVLVVVAGESPRVSKPTRGSPRCSPRNQQPRGQNDGEAGDEPGCLALDEAEPEEGRGERDGEEEGGEGTAGERFGVGEWG